MTDEDKAELEAAKAVLEQAKIEYECVRAGFVFARQHLRELQEFYRHAD